MLRTILLALALVAAGVRARADERPIVLVHTGYLLDGNDHPVTEPELAMTFRVLDQNAPVDTEHELWTASCTVDVEDGHYAVALGQECGTNLLPSMLPTDAARYLEVAVAGTRLLPRMMIGTVPTAAVSTNALAVGGESLGDLDGRYAKFQSDATALVPQAGSLAVDGTLAAANGFFSGDVGAAGALHAASLTTSDGATVGADLAVTGRVDAGSLSTSGDASIAGRVDAAAFAGDGSKLTNLDASQLTTGTLADGRLAGTQSGEVSFPNASNSFAGAFTGTFSGTLSGSASGTFSGTVSGDGSGLTGLDASDLATGTIPAARLPSDSARVDAANDFARDDTFDGRVEVGVAGLAPWATLAVGEEAAGDGANYELGVVRHGTLASPGSYASSAPALRIEDLAADGPATPDDQGVLYVAAPRIGDADPDAANASLLKVVNDNGVALNVTGDRNVGIGTATPGARLDVAGDIHLTGQLEIAGGAPGAGKVLTSDAAGLASWQAPTGGAGPYVELTYSGSLARGNAIPFTVADDSGGGGAAFSGTTFTAPVDGLYLVTAEGFWNATSYGSIDLVKNGASLQTMYGNTEAPTGKTFTSAAGSLVMHLAKGDTVQVRYQHDFSNVYLTQATASITFLR